MPFPFKKHKFNAKPFEYNGRKYPSTAQAERAMALDGMIETGDIYYYLEEVKFPLGEDDSLRVDFLVFAPDIGLVGNCPYIVHAEDVKGAETKDFLRKKKLWAKYGPFPLHVIKGKKTEIVEGAK